MALSNVQHRSIDKSDLGGTLTYSFASTPTDGNLLLLFAASEENGAQITSPSGWTVLDLHNAGSFESNAGAWYKWASSESNSYGIAAASPGWNGNAMGVELSGGAGSGDPADVAFVVNSQGFSAPVIKDVTTATDHDFVFGFATQHNQDPASLSTPSGWTKLDASGNTRGGVLFYIDKTPAGSTGDQTLTGGNSFPNVNYTYAIKPSGGGGGVTNHFLGLLGCGV